MSKSKSQHFAEKIAATDTCRRRCRRLNIHFMTTLGHLKKYCSAIRTWSADVRVRQSHISTANFSDKAAVQFFSQFAKHQTRKCIAVSFSFTLGIFWSLKQICLALLQLDKCNDYLNEKSCQSYKELTQSMCSNDKKAPPKGRDKLADLVFWILFRQTTSR